MAATPSRTLITLPPLMTVVGSAEMNSGRDIGSDASPRSARVRMADAARGSPPPDPMGMLADDDEADGGTGMAPAPLLVAPAELLLLPLLAPLLSTVNPLMPVFAAWWSSDT